METECLVTIPQHIRTFECASQQQAYCFGSNKSRAEETAEVSGHNMWRSDEEFEKSVTNVATLPINGTLQANYSADNQ